MEIIRPISVGFGVLAGVALFYLLLFDAFGYWQIGKVEKWPWHRIVSLVFWILFTSFGIGKILGF